MSEPTVVETLDRPPESPELNGGGTVTDRLLGVEEPPGEPPGAAVSNTGVADKESCPGYLIFRILVPESLKLDGVGQKGGVEDMVRVLKSPPMENIVLVYAKDQPHSSFPPAIDAILKISRLLIGLPEEEISVEKATSEILSAFRSVRLLVASAQATSLMGEQGSVLSTIQQTTGASIRLLSHDKPTLDASPAEEVTVEIQGKALKVYNCLKVVVDHLRKCLVEECVIPFFDKYRSVKMAGNLKLKMMEKDIKLADPTPPMDSDRTPLASPMAAIPSSLPSTSGVVRPLHFRVPKKLFVDYNKKMYGRKFHFRGSIMGEKQRESIRRLVYFWALRKAVVDPAHVPPHERDICFRCEKSQSSCFCD